MARFIDDEQLVEADAIVDGKPVKRPFRVRDFLRHIVRSGAQFNQNYEGMRVQGRIEEAIDQAPKSGAVQLDEADWEKVCAAVENPTPLQGWNHYPLNPAHLCARFVRAVLDAPKTLKKKS